MNLKVITSTGSPAEAYVELDQTVSDFPFGAATAGSILVSEDYQRVCAFSRKKELLVWIIKLS